MNTINISQDIIPVNEFKAQISKWLKSINEKQHSVVITQNGRPAGVLLTPEEYDQLMYTQRFLSSIAEGLEDVENGNVYSTEQLREKLR